MVIGAIGTKGRKINGKAITFNIRSEAEDEGYAARDREEAVHG